MFVVCKMLGMMMAPHDYNPGHEDKFIASNRYIAREILKRKPAEWHPDNPVLGIATTFVKNGGSLLSGSTDVHTISEIMSSDNVCLLLLPGFDEQYGEATKVAVHQSTVIGRALANLCASEYQFALGSVYAQNKFLSHMSCYGKKVLPKYGEGGFD